ncbi:hypothetical protein DFH08DRAFT_1029503 [Mycena albidolilacea]|uniref:Uncharacterized protein n=1 Tax=Mycena albidolilacea TaxID=1033008 RepID=A0AAD6ZIM7_9AGAR|nr:hypothetical protein DFH08DRAFT_1029503 [Mycena albidolilacea]
MPMPPSRRCPPTRLLLPKTAPQSHAPHHPNPISPNHANSGSGAGSDPADPADPGASDYSGGWCCPCSRRCCPLAATGTVMQRAHGRDRWVRPAASKAEWDGDGDGYTITSRSTSAARLHHPSSPAPVLTSHRLMCDTGWWYVDCAVRAGDGRGRTLCDVLALAPAPGDVPSPPSPVLRKSGSSTSLLLHERAVSSLTGHSGISNLCTR